MGLGGICWRGASHHYTLGEEKERKEGWREWMMHNMLVWRRRKRRTKRKRVRRNARGGNGENKDAK